jgi:hypothetical protein
MIHTKGRHAPILWSHLIAHACLRLDIPRRLATSGSMTVKGKVQVNGEP